MRQTAFLRGLGLTDARHVSAFGRDVELYGHGQVRRALHRQRCLNQNGKPNTSIEPRSGVKRQWSEHACTLKFSCSSTFSASFHLTPLSGAAATPGAGCPIVGWAPGWGSIKEFSSLDGLKGWLMALPRRGALLSRPHPATTRVLVVQRGVAKKKNSYVTARHRGKSIHQGTTCGKN